ncbi:MAG: DUF6356 family protein [Novosphingobium sp.]
MLRRLFFDHLRAVEETWAEHFAIAFGFGTVMLVGALGALVHAFFPGLCKSTGSRALHRLNAMMDRHRAEKGLPHG